MFPWLMGEFRKTHTKDIENTVKENKNNFQ